MTLTDTNKWAPLDQTNAYCSYLAMKFHVHVRVNWQDINAIKKNGCEVKTILTKSPSYRSCGPGENPRKS